MADLNLLGRRITVQGLRRNNIEISQPDVDAPLHANDVIVISGKPRRVERTERFLLEGH